MIGLVRWVLSAFTLGATLNATLDELAEWVDGEEFAAEWLLAYPVSR